MEDRRASPWAIAIGVAWCFIVPFFYYLYNHAYYQEKIGLFSRFFLGRVT
jgi:hypothetical protein